MDKQDWIADDLKYVWHPFTQMKQYEGDEKPICIVKGEGIYIEDIDGNRYMDSVSSWWVNSLGHAQPRLAKALYEQACAIEQVIFAGFTHKPAISLAKKLITLVNNRLKHVLFRQRFDSHRSGFENGVSILAAERKGFQKEVHRF